MENFLFYPFGEVLLRILCICSVGTHMNDIYKVDLFQEEGFEQKECKNCGRTFWTLDSERKPVGIHPVMTTPL